MRETPLHLRTARMERFAAENPAGHRRRIAAWIVFGIAVYILLIGVALLLLAAPLFTYRRTGGVEIHPLLLIAGGLSLYGLVAALFIRADDPRSHFPVGREDGPGLWSRIDQIAARLDAPPIGIVTLDLQFNASVRRRARFLLWGRGEPELRLGLPLILMSDPDELASVIAHELGHHRAGHLGHGLRLMRIAYALEEAGQRLEKGGWIGILAGPLSRWYVPRLDLLVLPIRKEHEREAERAVRAVGLAEPACRLMGRATRLGPWFANAFFAHRPSFASLRAGMERPIPPEALARSVTDALHDRGDPTDEHPSFGERLRLMGLSLSPEDPEGIAALARDCSRSRSESAWEAFFSAPFRERIEGEANEIFGEMDRAQRPFSSDLVWEAYALAVQGDEEGARAALHRLATDPSQGPVTRVEAARALLAQDYGSPEAVAVLEALVSDPYVGLDVRMDLAYRLDRRFREGYPDVTERQARDAFDAANGEYELRRTFVARIHNDPGVLEPIDRPIPPDVLHALVEAAEPLTKARRAWALWARHPRTPGAEFPLVVLDLGLEIRSFRISREDSRSIAEATEKHFGGPVGIATLVGRGAKELAEIVGERAPFWTAEG